MGDCNALDNEVGSDLDRNLWNLPGLTLSGNKNILTTSSEADSPLNHYLHYPNRCRTAHMPIHANATQCHTRQRVTRNANAQSGVFQKSRNTGMLSLHGRLSSEICPPATNPRVKHQTSLRAFRPVSRPTARIGHKCLDFLRTIVEAWSKSGLLQGSSLRSCRSVTLCNIQYQGNIQAS